MARLDSLRLGRLVFIYFLMLSSSLAGLLADDTINGAGDLVHRLCFNFLLAQTTKHGHKLIVNLKVTYQFSILWLDPVGQGRLRLGPGAFSGGTVAMLRDLRHLPCEDG